jgi:DNA-binding CsgD family transcriptional regulator
VEVGENLVPASELRKTGFHHDFGKRYGYFGGLTGILSATSVTQGAAINLCRSENHSFGTADVQLIRTLMPHLRRALDVRGHLAEGAWHIAALRETLSRLSAGAVIVDGHGAPLFINDSAGRTLQQRDGLTLDGQVLRASRSDDTRRLRSLMAGAARTTAGEGLAAGGLLVLRRPSGKRSLQLTVSPVPAQDERFDAHSGGAVVFIVDPEQIPVSDWTGLRRLHDLSAAESEVARLLVQDKSVAEIAETLGVSRNTIRFHLKRMFAKTATRRQSELVRLLLISAQIR